MASLISACHTSLSELKVRAGSPQHDFLGVGCLRTQTGCCRKHPPCRRWSPALQPRLQRGPRPQRASKWLDKLMGTVSEDTESSTDEDASAVVDLIASDLDAFLAEAGPRLCIVDFYTVWCGPCKIVDKNLQKIAKKCQNVRFGKYDCELPENEDLASEMNVHELPTLILFRDGQEMKRFSGVASLGEVMGMAEIWNDKFAAGEL